MHFWCSDCCQVYRWVFDDSFFLFCFLSLLQGCIYLIKNAVKTNEYYCNFIITMFSNYFAVMQLKLGDFAWCQWVFHSDPVCVLRCRVWLQTSRPQSYCGRERVEVWAGPVAGQPALPEPASVWRISHQWALDSHCCALCVRVSIMSSLLQKTGPSWFCAGPHWFIMVSYWSRLFYPSWMLLQTGSVLVQTGL